MNILKHSLLAILLMALLPAQSMAKPTVAPKAYMFGFIANFTDSVVYFTDIQTVDSVWYDSKTKFLLGRSSYSHQLRNYFSETLNKPNSTCVVIYGLNRQDAEKKLVKLKKIYTVKHAGKYDVRNLNENEFHFTTVDMRSEEEKAAQAASSSKRPDKARKDGRKGGRKDGRKGGPRP